MKTIISLIFLLVSLRGYSQEVLIKDSLSIEVLKDRKVSNLYVRSSTILKNKEMQKIMARCRVKALYKQPVDINAFSLLDTVNKIRYRIIEYNGYKAISYLGIGKGSTMYLKNDLRDKKGKAYRMLPFYDPSIKDSFEDFKFEGYTNLEMPLNFGTNKNHSMSEIFDEKKNLISPVYYSPTRWNQFTAELFFTIINTVNEPKLYLYYGYDLIDRIEI